MSQCGEATRPGAGASDAFAVKVGGGVLPDGIRAGDIVFVEPAAPPADGRLCLAGGAAENGEPILGTYAAADGALVLADGTRRVLTEGARAWPVVGLYRPEATRSEPSLSE